MASCAPKRLRGVRWGLLQVLWLLGPHGPPWDLRLPTSVQASLLCFVLWVQFCSPTHSCPCSRAHLPRSSPFSLPGLPAALHTPVPAPCTPVPAPRVSARAILLEQNSVLALFLLTNLSVVPCSFKIRFRIQELGLCPGPWDFPPRHVPWSHTPSPGLSPLCSSGFALGLVSSRMPSWHPGLGYVLFQSHQLPTVALVM